MNTLTPQFAKKKKINNTQKYAHICAQAFGSDAKLSVDTKKTLLNFGVRHRVYRKSIILNGTRVHFTKHISKYKTILKLALARSWKRKKANNLQKKQKKNVEK